MIRDDRLRELAPEVVVRIDRAFEARYPGESGSQVKVILKDGTVLKEAVRHPKGDRENPVRESELRRKLLTLAHRCKSEDQAAHLLSQLMSLETIEGVGEIEL
jgi:2-methylcitrate dehydratase PrpD